MGNPSGPPETAWQDTSYGRVGTGRSLLLPGKLLNCLSNKCFLDQRAKRSDMMMTFETKCRRVYLPGCCVLLSLMFLAALALLIDLLLNASPSRVFRRYVLDPIPASVTEIKADRPWEFTGHRYILQFSISRADVQSILKSRAFKEIRDVEYDNGALWWWWIEDPHRGGSVHLYAPYDGRPGPEWFRPQDWHSPQAYALQEQLDWEHIQVLLYNEQPNPHISPRR